MGLCHYGQLPLLHLSLTLPQVPRVVSAEVFSEPVQEPVFSKQNKTCQTKADPDLKND